MTFTAADFEAEKISASVAFAELFPELVPRDIDAETGILGRLLLDPNLPLNLGPERFQDPRHEELYRVIEDARSHGTNDVLNFLSQRLQIHRIATCGGVEYIHKLMRNAAEPTEIPYCTQRVNEMWRRRVIAERMQRVATLAACQSTSFDDLLANIDIHAMPELTDGRREHRFRLFNAAQLNSGQFEPRFLIPGLLAAGQPGGLFGPFKTLKTSLTADLLISLASGTPFLGHFPVAEPCPVLFLSGESGLAALQSIARRLATARGLSLDTLKNFNLSPDLPRLDSRSDMLALRRMVRDEGLKCVAIDPVYLTLGGDSVRNLFAMGALLRPIAELCESTGCTVLLVHHCKRSKLTPHDPASLSDIAWSGFAEFSAQWLLLSRRRPFDPDTGRHELWLNHGSRTGHAGLWALDVEEGSPMNQEARTWQTVIRPVSYARRQSEEHLVERSEERRVRRMAATHNRHRQRVLATLTRKPEGETARYFRLYLGLSTERANGVLGSLLDDGLIVPTEIKKQKRWEHGFRLTGGDDIPAGRAEMYPPGRDCFS